MNPNQSVENIFHNLRENLGNSFFDNHIKTIKAINGNLYLEVKFQNTELLLDMLSKVYKAWVEVTKKELRSNLNYYASVNFTDAYAWFVIISCGYPLEFDRIIEEW